MLASRSTLPAAVDISTPRRRIRWACCARAASGPTSAVLPRSAMNSRRLMEASPPAETSEQLRLSHRALCITANSRPMSQLGPDCVETR
jgi:hypothetical protein